MASLGTVYVTAKIDEAASRRNIQAFGSTAAKDIDHGVSGSGNKVGANLGKRVLEGFAAAGVAVGIAKVFRTGFSEVSDYQAGLSQLQAGLKSTGGVAGLTAGQMETLATKIQGYSGQTDDSIVKSESLLLTFRNIHDQTGKNNDIFTQATKATADMAARFGGSASDNAIKLGKALNDPVKGITALGRVGVQFTESQKATIKQMVATGDTLGAQKVILKEVNAEVGGSAAAYGKTLPGQIDKAHRKFEDISQTLVTKLTPAISTMLDGISKAVDLFGKYSDVIIPVVAALGTAVVVFKVATSAQALYAIATKTSTIATKDMTVAQALLSAVMDANPVFLVVAALAGLAAGLVIAYKKSETFRDIVKGALHVVEVAFDGVKTVAEAVFNWLRDNWPLLVGILTGPIGLAVYFISQHFAGFRKVAGEAVKAVVGFFLDMAGDILGAASRAFGWVPGLGGKLKSANKAFDDFKKGVLDDLTSLEGDHVVSVNVRTAIGDAAQAITNPAKAARYGAASGGLISGPGGPRDDLIPAYLSNGEFVMNAAATARHLPLLHALNAKGFADGGLVLQTNAGTAANGLGDQLRQVVDSALQKVASTFASFTGSIGGGVQQWAGLVQQVLAALGLSPGLLGKVLAQMTTESGGNPNIVNTTDSNAAAGHPSMGLMQVIGPTFAAYAGPYAGLGILNPFANIYAGLNYARNRYGPNLNGLGEGHGYDSGGRWPSGTLGWNTSGKDEYVITHGEMTEAVSLLRQLVKISAAHPTATADALNGTARRSRLDARTRTA